MSREYSGLGWVQYDALFRKHASLKADTKWSPTLYARCFTGAPREVVRCELCWATTDDTKDCLYLAGADSTIEFRVQNIEDSLKALSQQCSQSTRPQLSSEIYRKFNNEGCTYPYCRHTHVCMTCGVPIQKHNASEAEGMGTKWNR